MLTNKCIEITVSGSVQGVGFRWFIHQKAINLNLKGYVKNNVDGSVSIIACGEQSALDELLAHSKVGPSRSNVNDFKVKSISTNELFSEFTIR